MTQIKTRSIPTRAWQFAGIHISVYYIGEGCAIVHMCGKFVFVYFVRRFTIFYSFIYERCPNYFYVSVSTFIMTACINNAYGNTRGS